jgi:hypothetical protein
MEKTNLSSEAMRLMDTLLCLFRDADQTGKLEECASILGPAVVEAQKVVWGLHHSGEHV